MLEYETPSPVGVKTAVSCGSVRPEIFGIPRTDSHHWNLCPGSYFWTVLAGGLYRNGGPKRTIGSGPVSLRLVPNLPLPHSTQSNISRTSHITSSPNHKNNKKNAAYIPNNHNEIFLIGSILLHLAFLVLTSSSSSSSPPPV